MPISSIHFDDGHAGYFAHNDRSQATVNSIFSDEKNECTVTAKEAFANFRKTIAERTAKYTARTGQKLNAKTITHLSAIVNLEQYHTMDDLQEITSYLIAELDTEIFQISIHKDEGYVEDGIDHKNYHAHIEFSGLDSDGASIRRKIDKRFLSDSQTKVAAILGMKRGKNYIKEKLPRPRRLDTYDFKTIKKKEQEVRQKNRKNDNAHITGVAIEMGAIKPTKKNFSSHSIISTIKLKYAEMRQELIDTKTASKLDYDELKRLRDEAIEASKAKDLKIEDYEKQIVELKKTIIERTEMGLEAKVAELEGKLAGAPSKAEFEAVVSDLEIAETRIGQLDGMIEEGATAHQLHEIYKTMPYQRKTNAYETAKTRASEAYRMRLSESQGRANQSPSMERSRP